MSIPRILVPFIALVAMFCMDARGATAQSSLLVGNVAHIDNASNVTRYDAVSGVFRDIFITPAFGEVSGMTIGPDGNLYIALYYADEIRRYNGTTGAFIDVFVSAKSGGISNIEEIVFGPDGHLYVCASTTQHVVKKYHGTTGAYLGDFIPPNGNGLFAPSAMTFGPNGNFFVSSHLLDNTGGIKQYNGVTGAFINDFIPYGSGGLWGAYYGLAFGPDGNLYVSSFHTNEIKRYSGVTGVYLGNFVTTGSGGLSGPTDIAFRPDGSLYVVSKLNDTVKRYNGTTGAFLGNFVTVGLNEPLSLVFTNSNGQGNVAISQVAVSKIGANTATITWKTNIPADSQVDYGLTTAYGNSKSQATLTTNHSVTLTGLMAGRLYHFCVRSEANGETAESGDRTFVTSTIISGGDGRFSYILQRLPDGKYQADVTYTYHKIFDGLFQDPLLNLTLMSATLGTATKPSSPTLPAGRITVNPGGSTKYSLIFPATAGSPGSSVALRLKLEYRSRGLGHILPIYGSFRVTLP